MAFYLLIALALVVLALLALGFAGAHFAFKKPEGPLSARWRLSRWINWASFIAAMTLWSGAAHPVNDQFKRESFFTIELLSAALLSALIALILMYGLRGGSMARRLSAGLWLACCVWMGNETLAERLNLALASGGYAVSAIAQTERVEPFGRRDRAFVVFRAPLERGAEPLKGAWLSPSSFAALQAAPERSTLRFWTLKGPLGDPAIARVSVIPRALSQGEREQCDRSWTRASPPS